MFKKTNIKLFLWTLYIYSYFGWFTADNRGKLEDAIVSKGLPLMSKFDDPTWELPPEMQYRRLHASLIVKGITKFHINLLFRDSFGILRTSRFQSLSIMKHH